MLDEVDQKEIQDFALGMGDRYGDDAETLILISRIYSLGIDQVERILAPRAVDVE